MTAMEDVIIINEMDHVLDRFRDGKLTKKETLIELMKLFEELKGKGTTTKAPGKKPAAKPEKRDIPRQQAPQTFAEKAAAATKDFLFNPERNKKMEQMFGQKGRF